MKSQVNYQGSVTVLTPKGPQLVFADIWQPLTTNNYKVSNLFFFFSIEESHTYSV